MALNNPSHNHWEEGHFAASFTVLAQLRREDILTDISLTPAGTALPLQDKCIESNFAQVRAHKLVLMAASDYFRTMFKTCFLESDLDTLTLPGVDGDLLEPLVDYLYSGQITISNDNVIGLLQAASLLLLPRLVEACGQFLSTVLDQSNCLDILTIATSLDFGDSLAKLEKDAIRYIQLHFEAIWRQLGSIIQQEEDDHEQQQEQEEESVAPAMDHRQLAKLLAADDLCADSEESVFHCVQNWMQQQKKRSSKDHHLWECVRFSQLSSSFMVNAVESSPFFEAIKQTESYLNATASANRPWSRSTRRRGHNLEVVVAHADGDGELEYFNTVHEEDDHWRKLSSLPELCGLDGVAISGYRSTVFVVGGNSPLIKEDRKQGRTCFYYDLAEDAWHRAPSLLEKRWNHGLARIGDMLYAVGGCGQQNTMEALSLTDLEAAWSLRPSMECRRHVPGVGVLDGLIYVVGGADSQWNAYRAAEAFHPGINAWIQLPEMHCPRAQPAVVGHQGLLYVMGGRNSKKVELKSVECYDPVTNSWILLEDGLRKKRWSAAAVPFGQDNLMLIGGRGKWVQGNSVEIFCSDQWRLAAGPGPRAGHDKRYTATLVTRPSDRWGNGPSSS